MDWSYILLFGLGILSGLSVTYLGMGGSVYIVPLLPFLADLSPYETIQLSFLFLCVMAFINSIIFISRKMVVWSLFKTVASVGAGVAFLASLLISQIPPFHVRFTLWVFLGVILTFPFIIRRSSWILKKLPTISGTLMGLCSGLTGLGGGIILSPLFHESRQIPVSKIPGTVCLIMLPISFFGLLAQIIGSDFPASTSPHWWFVFAILLSSSLLGVSIGHSLKYKSSRAPRYYVRGFITLLFLKVTGELFFSF